MDDKDNPSPDPWAGIDAEGAAGEADGFEFAFDDPADPGSQDQPAASQSSADDLLADDLLGEDDVIPMGEIDVDAWLTEPSADAGDQPAAPADPLDALGSAAPPYGVFSMDQANDTASVPFAGIVDDESPQADGDVLADGGSQSSNVTIGTGQSGVLSSSDVIPMDDSDDVWGNVVEADEEPAAVPDDGLGFAGEVPSPEAVDGFEDTGLVDFGGLQDGASDEADGFAGAEDGGTSGTELTPVGAAIAGIAADEPAATGEVIVTEPKPGSPRRKSRSGIGQLVGILLGGLMALPITYAILLWGLRQDPLKLAPLLPESLVSLLPEQLQPGFGQVAANGSRPTLDQVPAFDPEPAAEPPATPAVADAATAAADPQPIAPADAVAETTPPAAQAMPATEPEPPAATEQPMPKSDQPPADTIAATAPLETVAPVPAPVEPPAPPALDTTALDAAVAKALELQDALAAVGDDPAARRKPLVSWYRGLAEVAEQLAMLENVALDTGRPLDKLPSSIGTLQARLVGSPVAVEDLGRLGAMWLTSKKRPGNGAVLVATFDGVRQVGPYWSSSITLGGDQPRAVSIISRRAPAANAGEQVLVSGLVFDGDVLWATDCSRLEKLASPAEDLF